MKKTLSAILLIFWLLVILTIFYVVQKPDFLPLTKGLWNLLLTLFLPAWMILLATCIGSYFLPECSPIERVIFGSAIGMGIFGLAGFGLAIIGWATQIILLALLTVATVYFIYSSKLRNAWTNISQLAIEIRESARSAKSWVPAAAGISIGLALLMGLAPPIEDFDALLYHLAVPSWWIRDGGLFLSTTVGYWVPHIVEGSFVIPLVFGVDSASHLIHLFWLVLSMLLVWHWGRQISSETSAWGAIAIILTMPSLLWLASWAYNDFTLAFTGMAVIYAVWQWQNTQTNRWAVIGGIMAGLAMGAKYQSFFMPVIGVLLILFWKSGTFIKRIKPAILFSAATTLFAFPWYLRNWIWTGNPIYPFMFGGPQWDSFLTAIQPGIPGSGIGYDPLKLLLLPFTTTFGVQDANFFDGRIGPFFLILLPITLWFLLTKQLEGKRTRQAIFAILLLSLTGIASWVMGVINISNLFQSRYLFPSLIPLAIPLAMGLESLKNLDTPRLKISFIFQTMLAFAALISIFNFGLQTLVRNPLSVSIGMISRQDYIETRQEGYAQALELINHMPANAKVYFLYEPRAYGFQTYIVPDSILAHFEHDLWLLGSPEAVFSKWKEEGYTHVLISQFGVDFKLNDKPEILAQLEEVKKMMIKVGETPNGEYDLYQIP